jgi:hypothetical protein
MNLCECGCGRPTLALTRTYGKLRAGDYRRFAQGHNGKTGKAKSYPERGPKHDKERVHRLRAEAALGKPLPVGAQVHHADGSKRGDAPLVICQDQAYHYLLHRRKQIQDLGGDPHRDRLCRACQSLKPFSEFNRHRRESDGLSTVCRLCQRLALKARYQRRIPPPINPNQPPPQP